ncbi:hypothetical protein K9N68_13970 [Kovacikia minuta CCNUW1]|uniref:hypothetical protein n=1 Tax=Kovacikia minuta TaxID=2931930 RepID=UPI001CCF49EB|nr:hypothetical protein [Kovacikia minuta]UBF28847.1 hypothetical protein K9N68_13970 [Kovacikia minuta CCNUW1]
MIAYCIDQWKQMCWRRGDRYYHCRLKQDLFGNWLLVREWGGLASGKRGTKEHLCESFEAGLFLLEIVSKQRHRRQYVLQC